MVPPERCTASRKAAAATLPKASSGMSAANRRLPWRAAKPTTRAISMAGWKLKRWTPRPATCRSFEKATTGTLACRLTGATAATDLANSGPRIRLAPSLMASLAAATAPSGVPLSSLTMSCRFGLSRSNSASSPACLSALPIKPGWPCADNEASSATLTGAALPGGIRSGEAVRGGNRPGRIGRAAGQHDRSGRQRQTGKPQPAHANACRCQQSHHALRLSRLQLESLGARQSQRRHATKNANRMASRPAPAA